MTLESTKPESNRVLVTWKGYFKWIIRLQQMLKPRTLKNSFLSPQPGALKTDFSAQVPLPVLYSHPRHRVPQNKGQRKSWQSTSNRLTCPRQPMQAQASAQVLKLQQTPWTALHFLSIIFPLVTCESGWWLQQGLPVQIFIVRFLAVTCRWRCFVILHFQGSQKVSSVSG